MSCWPVHKWRPKSEPKKEPLTTSWQVCLKIYLNDKSYITVSGEHEERPESKWEPFEDFRKWYFDSKRSEFLVRTRDVDILVRRTDIAGLEVRVTNLEESK